MTTPLDNFDKMQQTLEKSLRIAEAFNNQVFAFNDALRPLASNFCATASAINSSAIIDAARSLSSSRFPSVLDAVNRSGVITATNVLTDRLVSSIASISSVLNSNNLSFLSDAVRASDHQSAIASDKLLAEEQKQTEYLREISESLKSCECNKHIDSPDREQKHHYPKE